MRLGGCGENEVIAYPDDDRTLVRVKLTISAHAQEQARERGVTELEIAAAVSDGTRFAGHSGRIGAALIVPYNKTWGRRGRIYPHKRVVVFFVEDAAGATVVTVISQYGRWEA
jgi:hypothetical protein